MICSILDPRNGVNSTNYNSKALMHGARSDIYIFTRINIIKDKCAILINICKIPSSLIIIVMH